MQALRCLCRNTEVADCLVAAILERDAAEGSLNGACAAARRPAKPSVGTNSSAKRTIGSVAQWRNGWAAALSELSCSPAAAAPVTLTGAAAIMCMHGTGPALARNGIVGHHHADGRIARGGSAAAGRFCVRH